MHELKNSFFQLLLVLALMIFSGCESEPPSGDYPLLTRKRRYEAAQSFISDRETRKYERSEVRFHDSLHADLKRSLLPVFENDQYIGTRTDPIGWTVRIFDGTSAPLPPKIKTGMTVVYFDLKGEVVNTNEVEQ